MTDLLIKVLTIVNLSLSIVSIVVTAIIKIRKKSTKATENQFTQNNNLNIKGNSNIGIIGSGNKAVINNSFVTYSALYQSQSENDYSGKSNINLRRALIFGLIVIAVFTSIKTNIILIESLIGFVLLIVLIFAKRYIKCSQQLFVYIMTLTISAVIPLFILNNINAPNGFEKYFCNIRNKNNITNFIFSIGTNYDCLFYLLLQLLLTAIGSVYLIRMMLKLLKPVIYSLTKSHMEFVADKLHLASEKEFLRDITDLNKTFFAVVIILLILLFYHSQILSMMSLLMLKLFSFLSSILRLKGNITT